MIVRFFNNGDEDYFFETISLILGGYLQVSLGLPDCL